MILLLGAALAVLSIAVVVYPFLKSRSLRHPSVPGDEIGEQHAVPLPGALDLESIYQAIHTLRLEYQLGQVPEAVYREQLRAYRLEAAAALRQQAQAGAGAGVHGHASPLQTAEWSLEQKILLARATSPGDNSNAECCPQCGAAVGASGVDSRLSVPSNCPRCHSRLAASGPETPGVLEK